MIEMVTLDVGSGQIGRGDINLDIDKNWPITICADAMHIPFRRLDKIVSWHLIEHMPNPVKFLDELTSVAKLVEIHCPHKFSMSAKPGKGKTHLYFFDSAWFQNYARKRGLKCRVHVRLDIERVHLKAPFMFEIVAWFWGKA